jgi:hypothetical protein
MAHLTLLMDDYSRVVLNDGKNDVETFNSFREALDYVKLVYNAYTLELDQTFINRY